MSHLVGIDLGSLTSRIAFREGAGAGFFQNTSVSAFPMAKRSYPEKIPALFAEIKTSAEKLTGKEVSEAVCALPFCLTGQERQGLIDAARVSGIQAHAMHDSTAALLAYGVLHQKRGIFALASCGAGYFEVCIAEMSEGALEIKARRGLSWGGQDINLEIAARLQEEMQRQFGTDLREANFLEEIERAKLSLSVRASYDFVIALPERKERFTKALSRFEYYQWIEAAFQKIAELCSEVLSENKNGREIEGVFLAGGTAQHPLFRETLQKTFKKPFYSDIPCDLPVVYGAALRAGMLDGMVRETKIVEA